MRLVYRWLKLHLLYSRCDAPKGAIVVVDPTPWDGWSQSDCLSVSDAFATLGGKQ